MKKLACILCFSLLYWNAWAEHSFSCSEIAPKDLARIGKIWGFLKYHHPVVTSGKYDWDAELFSLMNRVANNQDNIPLNTTLEKWIDDLGRVKTSKQKTRYNRENIKLFPDNGWIRDTAELGASLSAKLVQIESAKKTKKPFYYQYNPEYGEMMPTNEKEYADVELDDNFRILSLFRFWNIIQYFYPYKYAIGEKWDDLLLRYIPLMTKPQTKREHILSLMKLNAEVNDAHVCIKEQDWVFGKNSLPCILSTIENKVIVTGFYNKQLGDSSGICIGDEILEMEGKPVNELITEIIPYCTGVNKPTQLRDACDRLVFTDKPSISLKITNEKNILTKEINCPPVEKLNRKARYQADKNPINIVDNIAYVYIGSLTYEDLDKRLPELLNTSGMILDLRSYPIDDAIYYLFDYLLPNKKIKFYQTTIPDIRFPGYICFQDENSKHFIYGLKRKSPYKGLVVILVDECTQSQAEFATMIASVIPGVKIIGSQTASTDGSACPVILPGKILSRFTSVGIYYPDRSETQRVGLKLTEEVHRTVEGVRTGKDPLINRGVELIKEKASGSGNDAL